MQQWPPRGLGLAFVVVVVEVYCLKCNRMATVFIRRRVVSRVDEQGTLVLWSSLLESYSKKKINFLITNFTNYSLIVERNYKKKLFFGSKCSYICMYYNKIFPVQLSCSELLKNVWKFSKNYTILYLQKLYSNSYGAKASRCVLLL